MKCGEIKEVSKVFIMTLEDMHTFKLMKLPLIITFKMMRELILYSPCKKDSKAYELF